MLHEGIDTLCPPPPPPPPGLRFLFPKKKACCLHALMIFYAVNEYYLHIKIFLITSFA